MKKEDKFKGNDGGRDLKEHGKGEWWKVLLLCSKGIQFSSLTTQDWYYGTFLTSLFLNRNLSDLS